MKLIERLIDRIADRVADRVAAKLATQIKGGVRLEYKRGELALAVRADNARLERNIGQRNRQAGYLRELADRGPAPLPSVKVGIPADPKDR